MTCKRLKIKPNYTSAGKQCVQPPQNVFLKHWEATAAGERIHFLSGSDKGDRDLFVMYFKIIFIHVPGANKSLKKQALKVSWAVGFQVVVNFKCWSHPAFAMAEFNTLSSSFPAVLQVFDTDLSWNKPTIPSEGSLQPSPGSGIPQEHPREAPRAA